MINLRHLFVLCGIFLLFAACGSEKTDSENCKYVLVTKVDMYVKDSHDNGKSIALAHRGQMFCLVDSVEGWYKVRLESGKEGYLNRDLAKVVDGNTIPNSAFNDFYVTTGNFNQHGSMCFKLAGDSIMMMRNYNTVPMDDDDLPVYQGSSIYYGTIEGNKLTFTRSRSGFIPSLCFEEMSDEDFSEMEKTEEIDPCVAYYSPVENGFIFEGGLFLSESTDVVELPKAHPLSARKAYGLYGDVESVTDDKGYSMLFDRVGNFREIKYHGEMMKFYSYNLDGTKYTIRDDESLYAIEYGKHERNDINTNGYDDRPSASYSFDKKDRIKQRVELVDMSYVTTTFAYRGASLHPDSMFVYAYDESGEYYTAEKYHYLKTDQHGNWLKRKVTRMRETTEYVGIDNDSSVVSRTESEHIETRTITYFYSL